MQNGRWPGLPGEEREGPREVLHFLSGLLDHGIVLDAVEDGDDEAAHGLHVGFLHAPRGEGRGAEADAGGDEGRPGLEGHRVLVDGASSQKQDGTKLYQPIHPSNLVITDIYLDDERRNSALNRKV